MVTLTVVLAVAALSGLLITPVIIRFAEVRGIFDAPSVRRVHQHPVPRLGGIAVCLATLAGLLTAIVLEAGGGNLDADELSFYGGVLLGGGVLFFVGLVDDLRGLRPVTKLVTQCAAAVAVYAVGFRIEALSIGPELIVSLGWLALPITVLWVAGVTNAFNLIDGLDGLASGVALVALVTTITVALVLGRWEVALVCAALIGALIGFVRYNFNPARIFLGDAGSMFIGFMLAVLSVGGSMKSTTVVLVIVPLSALALPLLDTALSMARRWLRGVPMSRADARHIHHQLLAAGLTHRSAVSVLYLAASLLAMLGLLLAFAPPTLAGGIAVAGGGLCLLLLLLGMRSLKYHEFLEAGGALVSAARTSRRVIRDRIQARDLAAIISRTRALSEVETLLHEAAADFGFAHMELCRSSASRPVVAGLCREVRAWKMEYPVMSDALAITDPYVLRIWCAMDGRSRPYGAERIARIVAPAVEQWLQSHVLAIVGDDGTAVEMHTRARLAGKVV